VTGSICAGSNPRITAAVCAYNAAAFLPDCITSLMDQCIAHDEYEVLLIDNNSTDDTNAIIRAAQRRYGVRLRLFTEREQGLSAARNCALTHAKSPVVAYVDADAVADTGWLAAILACIDEFPRSAVVGGRIEVQWDSPKPRWWDDRLDEAMGRFSPRSDQGMLKYPGYPYGGNFAVRTEAARELGGFCRGLGRKGAKLMAGEEGELCLRLERQGWTIHYTPHALIHHRATADRLTRPYILRRAFHHGRAQYRLEANHDFESGLYASPVGLLRGVILNALRWNLKMPYFKYLFFRVGYHYERLAKKLWRRARADSDGP